MSNLWIINQFANTPDQSGHTRQFEIADYLVKKGWKVSVFSSDFNINKRKFTKLKPFQFSLLERINGIRWFWLRVFPYKNNNWKRYINIISFTVHLFFKLLFEIFIQSINSKKPDIIFASSPQLPASFGALIISKIFFIPFVLEVRDLWPQVLIDEGGINKNNLLIKILELIEMILYKQSNEIIVLSKGLKNHIYKKGAKKITWLPNGSDLSKFKKKPLLKELSCFNKENPFKLIYAGAHGRSNALENVLKAADLLKNEPIKFIFIGDGPNKKLLKNQSIHMKNIEFRNPVPKESMPKIIESSHAMLITLKNNPLFKYGVSPNKLYDAYAVGRPVIVSIGGNINEEIINNKIGFACEPENPLLLAEIIKKLSLCTKSERQLMGDKARLLAESTYSRQKINPKINNLLKRIIRK